MASRFLALGRTRLTPSLNVYSPIALQHKFSTAVRPAAAQNTMFCYQCEQTKNNVGCDTKGVCGKDRLAKEFNDNSNSILTVNKCRCSKTANLQDLLIYGAAGVGHLAHLCKAKSAPVSPEAKKFLLTSIFSTLTNVNFDPNRIGAYIHDAHKYQQELASQYVRHGGSQADIWKGATSSALSMDITGLELLGREYGVNARKKEIGNDDFHGLQEMSIYGIKGAVAYFDHAERLRELNPNAYSDEKSDQLFTKVYELLNTTFVDTPKDLGSFVKLALDVGAFNVDVMATLDHAHADTFGSCVPTQVTSIPREGPAIVVSGHDMVDLYHVLKQTEGKGINVYTHGEMLPAHGYPKLKAFPHLAGHYGYAWMKQKKDFSNFPGAILMSSNCILDPFQSYADRIFTTNAVGVRASQHIEGNDFSKVIECSKKLPGFQSGQLTATSAAPYFMTGYKESFSQTDAKDSPFAKAVLEGKLKNVFVVGGCDGTEGDRNYFTQFGEQSPKDSVILTLGCGKFRLNHLPVARTNLEGTDIPRIIDVGQCNDAFGAIRMASSLATALGTTIDKLPLHFALSWFEQKAVAVLLSLLHLGVKGIHIGPNLPAFVTPNLLKALVDNFELSGVAEHAEDDIKKMTMKK